MTIILFLTFVIFSVIAQNSYKVSNYSMNWFAADQYCRAQNMSMIKISNFSEQIAATNYLHEHNSNGENLYWIGLSDLAQEGMYKIHSAQTKIPIYHIFKMYLKRYLCVEGWYKRNLFCMGSWGAK